MRLVRVARVFPNSIYARRFGLQLACFQTPIASKEYWAWVRWSTKLKYYINGKRWRGPAVIKQSPNQANFICYNFICYSFLLRSGKPCLFSRKTIEMIMTSSITILWQTRKIWDIHLSLKNRCVMKISKVLLPLFLDYIWEIWKNRRKECC